MDTLETRAPEISRRRFLTGCSAAGSLLLAAPLLAHVPPPGVRGLALHQLHTGEHLRATYWENGRYLPDALAEINHLLRDHRTGDIHPIDPGLLDTLARLREVLGTQRELHIISGYRSPKTNEKLRKLTKGVAKKSLHMLGKAIDIRVPGHSARTVQAAAISLNAGGVGLYEKSRFVHLDVGQVRTW